MRLAFWLAVFVVAVPTWLFMMYSVFRYASYGFALNSNRTSQANWIVRRLPLWFMLDGMLTPEGLALREPCILWLKRFFLSLAIFMLVIGIAMIVAWNSPMLSDPAPS